jgi:hypothetical protein
MASLSAYEIAMVSLGSASLIVHLILGFQWKFFKGQNKVKAATRGHMHLQIITLFDFLG